MKPLRTRFLVAAASLTLALSGCDESSSGAPRATVGPATSASAAPAAATAAESVTYGIEPSTSKVEWTGAKITGKHEGSFTSFKGTITVSGAKAENAKIHLDIDTPSLKVDPDKLLGHLKSPDFFDVEKFPKATFDSTAIAAGGSGGATHTITGNLALHGVTKSISFPATVTVTPGKVSAKAEFALARKDWNIVYPGMPNDLIKDDVPIHLTIEASKL